MMVLAGCIVATCSGCAALVVAGGAAAGAGTYAYMNGELCVSERATIDQAWDATYEAAKAMRLRPIKAEKDALTGKLHAKGVSSNEVFINLKSLSAEHTEIRIRVGVFGDEDLSERILTEIRHQLAAQPR